jgi:hypothetical protein
MIVLRHLTKSNKGISSSTSNESRLEGRRGIECRLRRGRIYLGSERGLRESEVGSIGLYRLVPTWRDYRTIEC